MIVVLSGREDLHATRVLAELDRLGSAVVLFDLASFPERARLTVDEGDAAPGVELEIPGHGRLRAAAIEAVWWRRPGLFLPAPPVADPAHREFVYRECNEAFAGLWASLAARWVNDPVRDEVASHKTFQLVAARRAGLRVPPTCVTNDPDAAQAFLDSRDGRAVVFKSLSATRETWKPTRIVGRAERDRIAAVRHAPVTFQEYVPGVDVRVTVVGDALFAAEIDARATPSPQDFRPVYEKARVAVCALPSDVEARLRALVSALGLAYAAIDLRRRDDGEHFFLEVNPAGQWLFVEERTAQPITAAVARLLAGR